ncbi:MAG TPA: hypothetical protein VKZ69_07980 [Limnochordales bacterium]|nr:hypothetical protein [Limnochordales bacterium]
MRRILDMLYTVLRRRKPDRVPQGLTPAERRALLGPHPLVLDKKPHDRAMETRVDPV